MNRRSVSVPASAAGSRLDLFLLPHLESQSRAAIQKMIHDGSILLNGQSVKASHKVHANDVIEILFQEVKHSEQEISPWNYPLEILHEDAYLLAIHKPPHVVTHPGAGTTGHTIANAILHSHPEIRHVGHPGRPGIVHRLDKETSGVLLIAKTDQSYQLVSAMFKDRKITKHYRALAFGTLPQKSGTIDAALGRDPRDRKKISVRARKSRTALTQYSVLENYEFGDLLNVRIFTGRTHQIRVHLSSIHHPIVGDSKYGGGNWTRIRDAELRERLRKAGFFGLHAFSLDFLHPITGASVHIEAPLPDLWRW